MESLILVRFGPFCFYFREEPGFGKKQNKIDSRLSPSYKILEINIHVKSFHGFDTKSIQSLYLHIKARFSVFPVLGVLLVTKSESS